MKKRLLSLLLVLVMVLGMLPASVFAVTDLQTIETGHVAEFVPDRYLSSITLAGATVTEQSGSDETWAMTLAEDTPENAELTLTLTASLSAFMQNKSGDFYFWCNDVKSEKSLAEANPGTVTVTPEWSDGSTVLSVGIGTATELNVVYTLTLTRSGSGEAGGDTGGEEVSTEYTIVTGDTYAPNKYLAVVTQCVVSGAKVLSGKVEEDGTKWTLTLPGNTDLTAELSYTLTTNIINKPDRNMNTNVSFNGGAYTAIDASTSTISFSGVPEWKDGEATVTFATRYQTKTQADRNRTYTLHLKLDDGVNDPPYLTGEAGVSQDMRINETYSVDLRSIFEDPDSADVTYQVSVNGADGVTAEAAYSYIPTEEGTYTLVFTASDGENTSEKYTVTLNVRNNAAPVLSGENVATETGMHGLTWNIDLSKLFADADGDALTYTVAVNEEAAVPASANYSYTPASAGTHTLVFKAADPKGAESPVYTVTLEAAENPAPTLTGDAQAAASVDQYITWTYDLSTIFADNEGDALTYTVSVNGAAAVSANASYSYAANTDGEQTFVFVATDKAGNSSPEHTVTLTVNFQGRETIYTYCAGRSGFNFDSWLSSITVTGPEITGYEWVGGGSGHDETSDEHHTLNIQLGSEVADDAVIALAYTLGGNTNQVKYSSTPPASVTLVDGQATVQVTTTHRAFDTWTATRTYTINFTNKTNTPPAATTEEITADVLIGETYSLDLSQYFTDTDGDALTYKVSVNGAEDVAADAAYTYIPTTLGQHVLVFKANDVWSDSTKNLTVTLNVSNSETTYDVTVTAPEGYTLTFQAVSAVENGAAVTAGELSYADGVVKVPENISIITWSAEGAAGGTAQVGAGAEVAIKTLTLSAKNAADTVDADSVIKVTDANGAVATVGSNGIIQVAAGSGYTYSATPSSDYIGAWNAVTLEEQTVAENAEVTLTYTLKNEKTVTVPNEAEVTLYYSNKNFAGSKVSAVYISDNEDGTKTYHYACTSDQGYNTGYVYRATWEGKLTKAGYMKNIDQVKLTWDEETPSPAYRGNGDAPNYSETVGTQQRRYGDAVLMTLNNTGHLVLETYKDLGAFRLWNIIDSDTTNVGIEPDFHFNVVAGDHVVEIQDMGSIFGNNWQKLVKNGTGTAFVEVSYDAIHIVTGWPEGGSGAAFGHMHDFVYNASDPNTNGLIVVQTDGNAASDVTFNIASDRVSLGRAWDAEHDTYYITENTGSLTLAPTATSGIRSVAVSNDKGATWTELTGTDGAYTATVVPGNNIIRVTNANGQTAYQVVRALKLDIVVENQTDPSRGANVLPGDTVKINITGLISPVGKMGGIYNPQGVGGSFVASDGVTYNIKGTPTGWTGGYAFNGHTYYLEDVVIPESGQLTLSGNAMTPGGFNVTLGNHRNITMSGTGQATGTGGSTTASILPVITLCACEHIETTTSYARVQGTETHTVLVTCANVNCGVQVGEVTTEDCVDENKDCLCDKCEGTVIYPAYTEAAILAEELTGEKTVEDTTVTLKATGEIDYLRAQGTGAWGNWVGFKLTAPEGVGMEDVTILRPDNATRNMAAIKDGDDYAYLYWNMQGQETAQYRIDWNSDGIYDLTVILDVAGATLKVPAHPELSGENTVNVSMRLGQWKEIDLSEYFTDADSENLTYYIMEDGAQDWVALTDSTYLYFPAGDGEQVVIFTALDETMTLADVDENTAVLLLQADVKEAPSKVTLTFRVTQGVDQFYTSDQSDIIAQQKITVPYFDLALYGLEGYYYNPRCYADYTTPGAIGGGTAGTQATAQGIVTPLHVYIWATEVFQLGFEAEDAGKGLSYNQGLEEYFGVLSGGAGSAYVNLWNGSNMNYYVNMQYPLGCPQTGSTCDQIALYDGDMLSIHFIEDTTVMGSSFAALVADENGQYDFASDAVEATVVRRDTVTLTAYQSASDWTDFITNYEPGSDAKVVYIAKDNFNADASGWEELGYTDSEGKIEIDTSNMTPGTYYIAVLGDVLQDASQEREMAMFTLTVEAPARRLGDVNNDGVVDTQDANLVISHRVGEITLSDAQLVDADVNGDGVINIADANLIVSFRFGEIERFPGES